MNIEWSMKGKHMIALAVAICVVLQMFRYDMQSAPSKGASARLDRLTGEVCFIRHTGSVKCFGGWW